ncbi:MAG: hypothetical protein ACJ8CR_13380 [Roseiflexaceae bacterium]
MFYPRLRQYIADNALHRGRATSSRLILPAVPPDDDTPAPPSFKTTPPELITVDRDEWAACHLA